MTAYLDKNIYTVEVSIHVFMVHSVLSVYLCLFYFPIYMFDVTLFGSLLRYFTSQRLNQGYNDSAYRVERGDY